MYNPLSIVPYTGNSKTSKVNSSPSISEPLNSISTEVSSAVVTDIASATGISFTDVTTTLTSSESVALPWESSTVKVNTSVPFQS